MRTITMTKPNKFTEQLKNIIGNKKVIVIENASMLDSEIEKAVEYLINNIRKSPEIILGLYACPEKIKDIVKPNCVIMFETTGTSKSFRDLFNYILNLPYSITIIEVNIGGFVTKENPDRQGKEKHKLYHLTTKLNGKWDIKYII